MQGACGNETGSRSALFIALESNIATLRRRVSTRDALLAVGALYGPIVGIPIVIGARR